jgi:hypothetical protein
VPAERVSADCVVHLQRLVAVDGRGAGGRACTDVTDDEPAPDDVHDRLPEAGLSEGRIAEHVNLEVTRC